jgi:hypothetical protein
MKRSLTLQPIRPIAEFVDTYGDRQIIHRPRGNRISIFKGGDTPALRMNRACSVLIGQRVKLKRTSLKMTQRQLCLAAGLVNVNPKQYIHAIENATRLNSCKHGTLYALAYAMKCDVCDLMPSVNEVIEYAEMNKRRIEVLS